MNTIYNYTSCVADVQVGRRGRCHDGLLAHPNRVNVNVNNDVCWPCLYPGVQSPIAVAGIWPCPNGARLCFERVWQAKQRLRSREWCLDKAARSKVAAVMGIDWLVQQGSRRLCIEASSSALGGCPRASFETGMAYVRMHVYMMTCARTLRPPTTGTGCTLQGACWCKLWSQPSWCVYVSPTWPKWLRVVMNGTVLHVQRVAAVDQSWCKLTAVSFSSVCIP